MRKIGWEERDAGDSYSRELLFSRGKAKVKVKVYVGMNRTYGVLLTDGANARIEESTIEISNSDKGNSAAIGAFRGINLRLRGDNVIRNNGDDGTPGNADDGFSLDLFHSVDFRQDGGHTTFIGPMEFGNLTNASLRDSEIKGGIDVFGGARVEVRKSSTGSNELTGGGDITVSGDSQLNFSRPNISVDVGSIEVNEFSRLNLRDNVSVTTAGDVNMGRSVLTMASNSSMNVGGNFGANATIIGVINCNGGDVSFGSIFSVSGGFLNCISFP